MVTIRDQHDHVFRCDIYRYLPAVDHALLKDMFRRHRLLQNAGAPWPDRRWFQCA
jgi:hypothetical protein